jgi:hypothetical protein
VRKEKIDPSAPIPYPLLVKSKSRDAILICQGTASSFAVRRGGGGTGFISGNRIPIAGYCSLSFLLPRVEVRWHQRKRF